MTGDPPRWLEPGLTIFSAAETRIAVLCIGATPPEVFHRLASLVTRHRLVELRNIRSFYAETSKSPLPRLPWRTGCIQLRFLAEGDASSAPPPRAPASAPLFVNRAVRAVVGIMHCPTAGDDPTAAVEDFDARCRRAYPEATVRRVFAFDPPRDGDVFRARGTSDDEEDKGTETRDRRGDGGGKAASPPRSAAGAARTEAAGGPPSPSATSAAAPGKTATAGGADKAAETSAGAGSGADADADAGGDAGSGAAAAAADADVPTTPRAAEAAPVLRPSTPPAPPPAPASSRPGSSPSPARAAAPAARARPPPAVDVECFPSADELGEDKLAGFVELAVCDTAASLLSDAEQWLLAASPAMVDVGEALPLVLPGQAGDQAAGGAGGAGAGTGPGHHRRSSSGGVLGSLSSDALAGAAGGGDGAGAASASSSASSASSGAATGAHPGVSLSPAPGPARHSRRSSLATLLGRVGGETSSHLGGLSSSSPEVAKLGQHASAAAAAAAAGTAARGADAASPSPATSPRSGDPPPADGATVSAEGSGSSSARPPRPNLAQQALSRLHMHGRSSKTDVEQGSASASPSPGPASAGLAGLPSGGTAGEGRGAAGAGTATGAGAGGLFGALSASSAVSTSSAATSTGALASSASPSPYAASAGAPAPGAPGSAGPAASALPPSPPIAAVEDESRIKRRHGRLRKAMADRCLLAGSPGDAAEHYRTAIELSRAAGDWAYLAAALLGSASAAALRAAFEARALAAGTVSIFDLFDTESRAQANARGGAASTCTTAPGSPLDSPRAGAGGGAGGFGGGLGAAVAAEAYGAADGGDAGAPSAPPSRRAARAFVSAFPSPEEPVAAPTPELRAALLDAEADVLAPLREALVVLNNRGPAAAPLRAVGALCLARTLADVQRGDAECRQRARDGGAATAVAGAGGGDADALSAPADGPAAAAAAAAAAGAQLSSPSPASPARPPRPRAAARPPGRPRRREVRELCNSALDAAASLPAREDGAMAALEASMALAAAGAPRAAALALWRAAERAARLPVAASPAAAACARLAARSVRIALAWPRLGVGAGPYAGQVGPAGWAALGGAVGGLASAAGPGAVALSGASFTGAALQSAYFGLAAFAPGGPAALPALPPAVTPGARSPPDEVAAPGGSGAARAGPSGAPDDGSSSATSSAFASPASGPSASSLRPLATPHDPSPAVVRSDTPHHPLELASHAWSPQTVLPTPAAPPLLRGAILEARMRLAIARSAHGEVWDASAALLREHSPELPASRQGELLAALLAASSKAGPRGRRRPGPGPPPLLGNAFARPPEGDREPLALGAQDLLPPAVLRRARERAAQAELDRQAAARARDRGAGDPDPDAAGEGPAGRPSGDAGAAASAVSPRRRSTPSTRAPSSSPRSSSVFLYDPFSAARRQQAEAEAEGARGGGGRGADADGHARWVAGETAAVEVEVSNPSAVAIRIDKLALEAEWIEEDEDEDEEGEEGAEGAEAERPDAGREDPADDVPDNPDDREEGEVLLGDAATGADAPASPRGLPPLSLGGGARAAPRQPRAPRLPRREAPAARHAAWRARPVALNVPPRTAPVRILLEGTPLKPGRLRVLGCRLTGLGGASWSQPFGPAGGGAGLAAGGGFAVGLAVPALRVVEREPPLPGLSPAYGGGFRGLPALARADGSVDGAAAGSARGRRGGPAGGGSAASLAEPPPAGLAEPSEDGALAGPVEVKVLPAMPLVAVELTQTTLEELAHVLRLAASRDAGAGGSGSGSGSGRAAALEAPGDSTASPAPSPSAQAAPGALKKERGTHHVSFGARSVGEDGSGPDAAGGLAKSPLSRGGGSGSEAPRDDRAGHGRVVGSADSESPVPLSPYLSSSLSFSFAAASSEKAAQALARSRLGFPHPGDVPGLHPPPPERSSTGDELSSPSSEFSPDGAPGAPRLVLLEGQRALLWVGLRAEGCEGPEPARGGGAGVPEGTAEAGGDASAPAGAAPHGHHSVGFAEPSPGRGRAPHGSARGPVGAAAPPPIRAARLTVAGAGVGRGLEVDADGADEVLQLALRDGWGDAAGRPARGRARAAGPVPSPLTATVLRVPLAVQATSESATAPEGPALDGPAAGAAALARARSRGGAGALRAGAVGAPGAANGAWRHRLGLVEDGGRAGRAHAPGASPPPLSQRLEVNVEYAASRPAPLSRRERLGRRASAPLEVSVVPGLRACSLAVLLAPPGASGRPDPALVLEVVVANASQMPLVAWIYGPGIRAADPASADGDLAGGRGADGGLAGGGDADGGFAGAKSADGDVALGAPSNRIDERLSAMAPSAGASPVSLFEARAGGPGAPAAVKPGGRARLTALYDVPPQVRQALRGPDAAKKALDVLAHSVRVAFRIQRDRKGTARTASGKAHAAAGADAAAPVSTASSTPAPAGAGPLSAALPGELGEGVAGAGGGAGGVALSRVVRGLRAGAGDEGEDADAGAQAGAAPTGAAQPAALRADDGALGPRSSPPLVRSSHLLFDVALLLSGAGGGAGLASPSRGLRGSSAAFASLGGLRRAGQALSLSSPHALYALAPGGRRGAAGAVGGSGALADGAPARDSAFDGGALGPPGARAAASSQPLAALLDVSPAPLFSDGSVAIPAALWRRASGAGGVAVVAPPDLEAIVELHQIDEGPADARGAGEAGGEPPGRPSPADPETSPAPAFQSVSLADGAEEMDLGRAPGTCGPDPAASRSATPPPSARAPPPPPPPDVCDLHPAPPGPLPRARVGHRIRAALRLRNVSPGPVLVRGGMSLKRGWLQPCRDADGAAAAGAGGVGAGGFVALTDGLGLGPGAGAPVVGPSDRLAACWEGPTATAVRLLRPGEQLVLRAVAYPLEGGAARVVPSALEVEWAEEAPQGRPLLPAVAAIPAAVDILDE